MTIRTPGLRRWSITDAAAMGTIWPGTEFRSIGAAAFEGTVARRTLPTVTIEGIEATPYAVRRDHPDAGRVPRTGLLLNAVVAGSGTVTRGEAAFDAHAGDVFLLRADRPFAYRCPVRTSTFRATLDESLLPPPLRGRYVPRFGVLDDSAVVRAFLTLAVDLLGCDPTLVGARASTAHLDAAVVALEHGVLAEELAAHPVAERSGNDDLLRSVLDHIELHLREPGLGPRTLAAAFGFSLRTLHGLFEPMPETVAERIRRRRIEEATAILRSRDAGTAELAGTLGFPSADSFRRAFQRAQGVTPAQYRALRRRIVG